MPLTLIIATNRSSLVITADMHVEAIASTTVVGKVASVPVALKVAFK